MKKIFLVLAFGLAATLTLAAQDHLPVTIMPLGDSLTDNFPGYRGPLFAKLAEAGFKVKSVGPKKADPAKPGTMDHAGNGGFTIGPGPSKADEWTGGKGNLFVNIDSWLKIQPDIVLLLIGTNEYFNVGTLQPDYKPNVDGPVKLGALLDKIHEVSPKSQILVSSIMPVAWSKDFAKPFNATIPALVGSRPYTIFVDLNTTAGFVSGDWSKDNLHPSEQGYAKMADGWFAALKPILNGH